MKTDREIVLVESIDLCEEGIQLTAVVENVHYIAGSQTFYDPPEYAPGRCVVIVPFEDLKDHMPEETYNNLEYMKEYELEEVLNRYANIDVYDWMICNTSEY